MTDERIIELALNLGVISYHDSEHDGRIYTVDTGLSEILELVKTAIEQEKDHEL